MVKRGRLQGAPAGKGEVPAGVANEKSTGERTELLTACYEEHAPDLLAFLGGILRDRDTAQEVLQETFLKAIDSAERIPTEAMRPWLFRVAFNHAISLKRREKVRQRVLADLRWQDHVGEPSPDYRLTRRELSARLQAAKLQLPEEQQQVVNMRINEGKTFNTIATELGIPLGTALTRMRLALNKLRTVLREDR